MKLSTQDLETFYKLNFILLQYANEYLGMFPKIKTPEKFRKSGLESINKVRMELRSHPEIIDKFLIENKNKLPEEELFIIESWKRCVVGKFYVIKHFKKYSIFLTESDPTKAYGVLSLTDELSDMLPYVPILLQATLLPFRDHIIYDGLFHVYPVHFGAGFRRSLEDDYRETKKDQGITEFL